MSLPIEVAVGWEKENENGAFVSFSSSKVSKVIIEDEHGNQTHVSYLKMFPNKHKKQDNHPDWRLVYYPE